MDYIKIEFEPQFPPDLRQMTENVLERTKWLFPLWCQKVWVDWNANEIDKSAEMILFKDYRTCRFHIYPSFLNYAKEEQFELALHEIIHCFTIPLKTACFDVIYDLFNNEENKDKCLILERQINKVMEQVTQDFAYALAAKFKE